MLVSRGEFSLSIAITPSNVTFRVYWRKPSALALLNLPPNTRGLLNLIPNTRGLLNLIPNTRGLLKQLS